MKRFAALLDVLSTRSSRNAKLALIADYLATTPDPDRGYALAAMTGDLEIPSIKPALVRELAAAAADPELFAMSYDYVGDLAETTALIWPEGDNQDPPRLGEIVEITQNLSRKDAPDQLTAWLDGLDATGRWALLKFLMGGLRIGVSARLAKQALANHGGLDVSEIEEVWHALKPPYEEIFAWADGKAEKPDIRGRATFRPVMLAHPLEEDNLVAMDPSAFAAEWKWDGIRVQIVCENGHKRLYSRTGEEISGTFPDLIESFDFEAVLDGELLVIRDGDVAPFNDLQKRLNRKKVGKKMLTDYPAAVRLYDLLQEGTEDLRALPFSARRARLEAWVRSQQSARLDLSPLVPFEDWNALAEARQTRNDSGIEGLMLKQQDSTYEAGRKKGLWFKWKRDPFLVDTVIMYAQRGHGKRSSYYSDFTFGCWADGELVPVGKAYFGFTDEELAELDRFVRNHTTNRFGPVREVEKSLVLEVAFEGLARSPRHKSGVAMRFPRIHRIRWDKPAEEADPLENLEALLPS